MIIITCIIMTEAFLKEANEFSDEEDDKWFEELQQIYTSNYMVIKEFA